MESPYEEAAKLHQTIRDLRLSLSETEFVDDDAKEEARYDAIWAENQLQFEAEQKLFREQQRQDELYAEMRRRFD